MRRVTPVAGLNRPNTGKEDDDDMYIVSKCWLVI
jgi:hypothetical protein